MAHELEVGLLAGGVSLVVATAGAYISVWSVNRQRTVALVVAALEHMTGGSQERGAGLPRLRRCVANDHGAPGSGGERGWTTKRRSDSTSTGNSSTS
jgi:hypothetical protein